MKKALFIQLLLCNFVYADIDFVLSIKNLSGEKVRIEPVRSLYSTVRINETTFSEPLILEPNEEVNLRVDSLTPKEKIKTLDGLQIVSGTKITEVTIHPSLLDEPLTSLERNDLNVEQECFQYGVGRCITIPMVKPKLTTVSWLFSVIKGRLGYA
jgi:hypothetical protein